MKKKGRLKLAELERKLQALEQKEAEWEKCRTQLQKDSTVLLNEGDTIKKIESGEKVQFPLNEQELDALRRSIYSFILWYDEEYNLYLKFNGQPVDDIKTIELSAQDHRPPFDYQCTRYMPCDSKTQVVLK